MPALGGEAELRALLAHSAIDQATERAIRLYGGELAGWLSSMIESEADAHDAFSWLCEELWRSLRGFDGRCSIRTWCYVLARHVISRMRIAPHRKREVLVSEIPSVAHAVDDAWNTTKLGARRAESVFAQLRRELSDDDQTLLVLRVDRGLNWAEIAQVLLGATADPDEVKRKAATLRKQFERLKVRLRERAAERLGD